MSEVVFGGQGVVCTNVMLAAAGHVQYKTYDTNAEIEFPCCVP